VLLPMTTLKKATIVAENIRKDMNEKQLKLKKTGERIGRMTHINNSTFFLVFFLF
jgi:PleD family two-component response regulator